MSHTSHPFLLVTLTVPLTLALPQQALGDSTAPETVLNTVVVTGTRSEKLLMETPVRTEVVTREEIERKHARDVKEALEDVPGLLLKRIHGKSGYEVWLQGLDSNRVKVLIDGEPVAASTGSSVDVTQIGSLNIERIEVVKGATSALYGSAAMGGVINIITRDIEPGLHYEALAEAASFGKDNIGGKTADIGARRASARLTGRDGAWYGALSMDYRDSDGFDATPENWTTQGAEGERGDWSARLGWKPDQNQSYELLGGYYREDLNNRISADAAGKEIRKVKEEEAERTRLGASAAWRTAAGDFQARLLQEQFDDVTYQDAIATAVKEDRRSASMETRRATLDWTYALTDDHLLSAGLEGFEETLEQRHDNAVEVPAGTDRHSIEVYLQDDYFISDRLEITPGIRLQRDSDFGSYAAPKINARYELMREDSLTLFLRGGVGRGYRVPNLKERYYVFDHSHLGYMVLGNPDLQPEKSTSYQLGVGAYGDQGAYVDLNLFYNDITDLIETAFDPGATADRGDGVSIHRYTNIAEASTRGAEISAAYPLSSQWKIHGGYTWMDSEDKRTGLELPKRPRHQVKLGADYTLSSWGTQLSLDGVFQSSEFIDIAGSMESPSWSTFDFKVNQPLPWGVTLFGGIDNLTDTQRDFSDASDFRPDEGRFFYLGVRIKG
ncbi:TonB-dependent receptor [Hahella sp. CR1]|uniref:TonB-dependent receptor plug domain-containing protein n=1 Tax=Hahella sp. CR1 TaxID=2992807 RepID=UPI002443434E|nr:TonB-dependent receptor [Hahella sp. CR1]MDG9671185.1 TonB-dependent receptor [Hahella sp. CR1]